MSDTIYETNGIHDSTHSMAVTRYWGGEDGDCLQFTIGGNLTQISLSQFREMLLAIEKNVLDTKDAWWHLMPYKVKL